MGVRNLWDVLESCKKTLPLHHLQNKRICIDLSCWIIRLENVTNGKSGPGDKLYLKGIFHRLRALIALNCSIILVSDGSIPAIKIPAYMRRLNKTTEINQGVPNSEKISLKRNKGSEFSRMTKETKILSMSLGIPCLDGIEEAEAQCALLNMERLCDGCFSPDSDIFLFGARTVYRDICLGDGGYVVCYEMSDIETKLGLGRSSLIALALVLGSDYNPGVPHLRHKAAFEAVKSIGDHIILQKVASEGLSFVKPKKTKRPKKSVQNVNGSTKDVAPRVVDVNGSEHCSATEYSYLDVIDAFLKPKCHAADSDAVYRVLVQHPYQHVKVQQVCGQFFQWTTDKTDELILPKIAERELRRFNNLRSTSSEFGGNFSLDEMPIKCPVSKIIKQRSIQGNEFFEVSWDDCFHGLKASIVPADLVRSACPEKVMEFDEEKAQKKVQNCRKPKAKKSEQEESSLVDIDRRLQKLLLEIESESSTITNHFGSSSPTAISEKSNPSSEGKERTNRGKGMEVREVIDLLSPSPPRPQRGCDTKGRENDVHQVVVELSDSENDESPDHARKARELREFLVCIKE